MEGLTRYDRKLVLTKKLDGSIELERKSEFVKGRKNTILTITNQRIGSGMWLLEKLKSMDSRRIDFFSGYIQDKLKQRKTKIKDDRIHREIANYVLNGNQFVY